MLASKTFVVVVLLLFVQAAVSLCNIELSDQWTGTFGQSTESSLQGLTGGLVSLTFASAGAVLETNTEFLRMSVWLAGESSVSIFDVNTDPTSYACNRQILGVYDITFSVDCTQFTLALVNDECFQRAQLYDQMSVSLTGACTEISTASSLSVSVVVLFVLVVVLVIF